MLYQTPLVARLMRGQKRPRARPFHKAPLPNKWELLPLRQVMPVLLSGDDDGRPTLSGYGVSYGPEDRFQGTGISFGSYTEEFGVVPVAAIASGLTGLLSSSGPDKKKWNTRAKRNARLIGLAQAGDVKAWHLLGAIGKPPVPLPVQLALPYTETSKPVLIGWTANEWGTAYNKLRGQARDAYLQLSSRFAAPGAQAIAPNVMPVLVRPDVLPPPATATDTASAVQQAIQTAGQVVQAATGAPAYPQPAPEGPGMATAGPGGLPGWVIPAGLGLAGLGLVLALTRGGGGKGGA